MVLMWNPETEIKECVDRMRLVEDLKVADHLFCDEVKTKSSKKYPNEVGVNTNLPRKIIQVSVTDDFIVCALCNDGTLWSLYGGVWTRLNPIPQDESN